MKAFALNGSTGRGMASVEYWCQYVATKVQHLDKGLAIVVVEIGEKLLAA